MGGCTAVSSGSRSTDMVMPRMSGRALAERFLQMSPLTRVMYVSGDSDEGASEVPGGILQKPFFPDQLLARVREVLGSEGGGASEDGTARDFAGPATTTTRRARTGND
jgi:DNA-binding response OmpR family regulator